MNNYYFINPFVPNAPFLYLLKTSENRFQEVESGCTGNEWVNSCHILEYTTLMIKYNIKYRDPRNICIYIHLKA